MRNIWAALLGLLFTAPLSAQIPYPARLPDPVTAAHGGTGAATLTGILRGNGTSAVTGLTTSAGIAGAISDETGSGALVFGTAPTFTGAVLDSATLGSEEIPALTAGSWTVGSGWESPIVGPGLIKNANGTGTQTPSAATTIVSGTTYKVVITLSALSAGTATYTLGAVTGPSTLSAAATYTDYITTTSTGKLIITPTNTSRFTISAISVKALTTPGSHAFEATLQVAGTGNWAASQTLNNNAFWKGTTSAGAASRMVGIDSSNFLQIGTPGGGETPLFLFLHGSNSGSAAIREDVSAVTNRNVALTSVGNSTVAQSIGCANTVTTDTLNVACLGANNKTSLSIDAGGADGATDTLFSLTKNDRTTKTYKLARDGYNLTYNNTTVAGTGLPFIPNVVALTGQTASIGTTNIQCTVAGSAGVCPAGLYRVIVEQIVTTAGTSGTVVTTIGWNDGTAARTSTPASTLTFGTTVRSSGSEYLTADGTNNITYATTVTAAVGSPAYALKITLERLQ